MVLSIFYIIIMFALTIYAFIYVRKRMISHKENQKIMSLRIIKVIQTGMVVMMMLYVLILVSTLVTGEYFETYEIWFIIATIVILAVGGFYPFKLKEQKQKDSEEIDKKSRENKSIRVMEKILYVMVYLPPIMMTILTVIYTSLYVLKALGY